MTAGTYASRMADLVKRATNDASPANGSRRTNGDTIVVVSLLLLAFFRIAYLWWASLGLVGDEAYYWDWSRQPAWGYYSKPPMVAWLIAAATALGGHQAETIRVLAVAFNTASLFLGYRLARELFDARTAVWFVAALALAPAALAQNLIFTIDAPLLFWWSAALLCLRRWLDVVTARSRAGWGAALAVCLGAGLLTKQMMAVFPLLASLYLATSPKHRARLRRPGFWVILVGAGAALVPLLLWNVRHDWIMARHTAHHFAEAPFSVAAALRRVAEFVGGEIAIIGFVTGIIALFAAGVAWRRTWRGELSDAERFLFWFSVPALTVMTLMAVRQRLNLNWPLVFLPPLVLLATRWSLPDGQGKRQLRVGRWLRSGIGVSAILTVLAYAYPVTIRGLGLIGTPVDLTVRLRGWASLAHRVDPLLATLRQESGSPVFILTVGHRYVTSQLAFHLTNHPQVMRWPSAVGEIESQYEVWGGLEDHAKEDALIVHQVDHRHPKLPPALRAAFASIEPLQTMRIPLGGGNERLYEVHLGHHFSPHFE